MGNERILIFQPHDLAGYTNSREGIEDFVDNVRQWHPNDIKGQFQLFPYVLPDIGRKGWNYAGIVYRREMKNIDEHPLNFIPGQQVVESFRDLASRLGAETRDLEFFKGRIEIPGPTQEQYLRTIEAAYSPTHEEFKAAGLRKPKQVTRFFLNLHDSLVEQIIMPYLELMGFKGDINVKKVA
ncbi:hypothetical protein J4234_02550 [Candidatus Woesearchaeota archaeon]|nr:hypothetical protein [Candidatus Woesearchaeota archaeon]